MMKFLGFFTSLLIFLPLFTHATILITNSSGIGVQTFYSNESIYIMSDTNISTQSIEIRVYVVEDSNAWTNGTTLSDVRGSYSTISTNSSGYIPLTLLWSPELTMGKYDVVIDVNADGIYENDTDLINSSTQTGFEVVEVPAPTLTIQKGSNSPGDSEIIQGNTSYIPVLQLVLSTNSVDSVEVQKIYVVGSGSGDDGKGVKMILVTLDSDEDGVYDPGETILGFGNFLRDNGLAELKMENFLIPRNSSLTILFSYKFYDSALGTFSFSVISYDTSSSSGREVRVVSDEIQSSTVTVLAPETTSTSTTTTTTSTTSTSTSTLSLTTTTTIPKPPSQQTQPEFPQFLLFLPAAIIPVIVLIYIFRPKKTETI